MKIHKLFCLLLIAAMLFTIPTFADTGRLNVGVTVDGATVQFPDARPYLDANANRVLVPVRFVSESLGAGVVWDGPTRTVTVTKGSDKLILTIDNAKVSKNGGSFTLDAPARVETNRTYVPLRFISEAFGATVEWSQSTKIVYITTKEAVDTATNPEFSAIMAKYPGKAVIGGRRNSLLFANNGNPSIYASDIRIGSDDGVISVDTQTSITFDNLKTMLSVYYPTGYPKAYDAIVALPVGIATAEMTLDGRYFAAKRFEDGYSIFTKKL